MLHVLFIYILYGLRQNKLHRINANNIAPIPQKQQQQQQQQNKQANTQAKKQQQMSVLWHASDANVMIVVH